MYVIGKFDDKIDCRISGPEKGIADAHDDQGIRYRHLSFGQADCPNARDFATRARAKPIFHTISPNTIPGSNSPVNKRYPRPQRAAL